MVEELVRQDRGRGRWHTTDENGLNHTLGYYPSRACIEYESEQFAVWEKHGEYHRESGRDWIDPEGMNVTWCLNGFEIHGRLLLW